MNRLLFGSAVVLILSALPASAQRSAAQLSGYGPGIAAQLPGVGPGVAARYGYGRVLGGGFVPNTPIPMLHTPIGMTRSAVYFPGPRAGFGAARYGFPGSGFGTYLAYPYGASAFYGGFGGGFVTGNYYTPTFVVPGPGGYYDDADFIPPAAVPPAPPTRIVELSGEATATLTLEFPAPATVWLNGQEVPGKADTVRTITSPVLRRGEEYTFHVRARWAADGKTYEYNRNVTLGAGDRSKLLVVSGTAVTGGE